MKRLVNILLSLLIHGLVIGQYHLALPNKSSIQNNINFPSFIPNYKLTAATSAFATASTPNASLSDFFAKNSDPDTSMWKFYKNPNKNLNNITADGRWDVLTLGYRLNYKNYFSYNASSTIESNINISKELLAMAWLGNKPFYKEYVPFNFNNSTISGKFEHKFTYANLISPKLQWGVSVGVINGWMDARINQLNGRLLTDTSIDNVYNLYAQSQWNIQTAGLIKSKPTTTMLGSAFNGSGIGYSLGLGFTFKPIEKMSIQLGITDFNSIQWKRKAYQYSSPLGEWNFDGVDSSMMRYDPEKGYIWNQIYTDIIEQNIRDSINTHFPASISNVAYNTKQKGRINLAFTYSINQQHTIAAYLGLNQGVNRNNTVLTANYLYKPNKIPVQLTTGIQNVNAQFTTVSLGIAGKIKAFSPFIYLNNAPGVINFDNTKFHSISLGLNINLHEINDDNTIQKLKIDSIKQSKLQIKQAKLEDNYQKQIQRVSKKLNTDSVALISSRGTDNQISNNQNIAKAANSSKSTIDSNIKKSPTTSIKSPSNTNSKRDTIYIRDTVFVKQFVIKRDTIYIEKTKSILPPTPTIVLKPTIEQKTEIIKTTEAKAKLITYEKDSYKLYPGSYQTLDELVDLMKQFPTMKLGVYAHSDNSGSLEYNLSLTDKRASTIKTYFVSQGIEAQRINAIGFGPTKPIGSNNTPEGRAQNRRTELVPTFTN
jgi:outer membrane protein OmpA-like peptidoglycan-associated protein